MKPLQMQVTDSLSVLVVPDNHHDFLIPTADVAVGYGVHIGTLRSHRHNAQDELIEGKHFISNVQILNGAGKRGATRTTMWTKAGVIRLGFFIKSERARLFRDWIENLVINVTEQKLPALPDVPKRKHNRLTHERLLDIMQDVCKIDDKELRLSISNKLMLGLNR